MVAPSRIGEPLLVVAAALTDAVGRVLIQRRPPQKHHGGLWEFPGGKVEPGETARVALVRELAEELAIRVDPSDAQPAGFALGDDALVLLLFRVRRWNGEPRALDATAIDWVTASDLSGYAMPPADRTLARTLWGQAL